jgi:hypothetical protein
MGFVATMTGAAVGVLAGVFIQYLLTLVLNSRSTRAQKNALRKEFEYATERSLASLRVNSIV